MTESRLIGRDHFAASFAYDRIVEFDGVPVPDLDAFLALASDRPNGRAVRLKTVGLDGKTAVLTPKPDPQFWPTAEIRRGANGWERSERSQPESRPREEREN